MGTGGVVGGGSGSGGGEQCPSKLRLAKDVISAGLPSDMTRRRPVDGEGDSRRWRGRCGGGPGVAVASPDAGEEVVAVAPRREAWWRDASVPAPTTSDRDVDQGLLLQWAFGRKA